MKKIIAAWIEQILEFDSEQEYTDYIRGLEQKNQMFEEMRCVPLESGAVRIRIRKQYNNNTFPESSMKGGEK